MTEILELKDQNGVSVYVRRAIGREEKAVWLFIDNNCALIDKELAEKLFSAIYPLLATEDQALAPFNPGVPLPPLSKVIHCPTCFHRIPANAEVCHTCGILVKEVVKTPYTPCEQAAVIFKCKYCGSEKTSLQQDLFRQYQSGLFFYVQCEDCKACGVIAETRQEAIKNWNIKMIEIRSAENLFKGAVTK